ncbi:MAG: hypothetical protein ABI581_02710 [Sediminibacterium sp.]
MKKLFITVFFLIAAIMITQAATIIKKNNTKNSITEKKNSKLSIPPQGQWSILAMDEHCSDGTTYT